MSPADNGSTSGEVKDRLNDLFGETQKATAPADKSGSVENSPLRDLKSTILSIDWEISDEILTKLKEDVDKLEDAFRHNKDLLLMVKLIGSLGKYIQKNKVNAHHSAIQLLNSTYNSLEKVMVSTDLSDSQKRRMLLEQVEKFKKLKEQLARIKAAATEKKGRCSAWQRWKLQSGANAGREFRASAATRFQPDEPSGGACLCAARDQAEHSGRIQGPAGGPEEVTFLRGCHRTRGLSS